METFSFSFSQKRHVEYKFKVHHSITSQHVMIKQRYSYFENWQRNYIVSSLIYSLVSSKLPFSIILGKLITSPQIFKNICPAHLVKFAVENDCFDIQILHKNSSKKLIISSQQWNEKIQLKFCFSKQERFINLNKTIEKVEDDTFII